MAIDNVTAIPLAPTNRGRKAKPAPSSDDLQDAINGLLLMDDWVVYQSESRSANEGATCAVMDLLDQARRTLQGVIDSQEVRHG